MHLICECYIKCIAVPGEYVEKKYSVLSSFLITG